MKDVIDHLNNHYNWAFELDTSSEFYLHVRDYIEIIIETKELSELMSQESAKIKARILEINNL